MKPSILFLALFALLVTASLCSCEKTSDPVNEPIDTIVIKTIDSVIILGSNSLSLLITPTDIILHGYYHNDESAVFDIDGDSIADLKLVSSDEGLAGTAPVPASYIKCLHPEVMLCNFHKSDTVTMKVTVKSTYDNGQIIIKTIRTFECNSYIPGDSITSVQQNNHLLYHNEGDSIAIDDSFESNSYTLARSPYSTPWMTSFQNDSLVITSMGVYNDNCYTLPDDTPVYIGIRIMKEGKLRLGWIKLSVKDYSIIHICETAIQKSGIGK